MSGLRHCNTCGSAHSSSSCPHLCGHDGGTMSKRFLWGAASGVAMSIVVVAVSTKAKIPGLVIMALILALQAWTHPSDTTGGR